MPRKLAVSSGVKARCLAVTLRSISRIAGRVGEQVFHLSVERTVLHQQLAHVGRTAARCGPGRWTVCIHSTRPALASAPTPISMQLTVQLPPIQLLMPLANAV